MSVNVKLAITMGVLVLPSLAVHEFAHVYAGYRMGDWSAKQWGRMTLDPRPHIDRFGSLVLPALLLILVAAGYFPPVFAYAKPTPFNPSALRNPHRGPTLFWLAGPLANLLLGIAFSGALAALKPSEGGWLWAFLFAGMALNVIFFVFNLLPIPGLDGAKLLSRVLPFRAREMYQRMDEYLALFMLLVFFLLSAPALSIVRALGNAVCRVIGYGDDCLP